MASCTWAISTASTSNAASYATGSFTPVAGDLLVVLVIASGTVAAGSVSNSQGTTFTKITSAVKAASADTLYLFVADAKSTAVSQTCTFACTGDNATGAVVTVYRISGMDKLGSAAVRRTAVASNQAAGGTPAATFAAAALTQNPTLAFCANGANPAALTPPTGWTETEGADKGYNTPTTGSEVAHRDSGFASTTITWGGTSGTAFGVIIAEFDTSILRDLTTASLTLTAAAPTPRLSLTATLASITNSAKAIQNALTQSLAAAAFAMSGQGVTSRLVTTATLAALNFTAQAITWSVSAAATVIDLTAASLGFAAQAVQSAVRTPLAVGVINFTAQAIDWAVTGSATVIDLTTAALSFVARTTQNTVRNTLTTAQQTLSAASVQTSTSLRTTLAALVLTTAAVSSRLTTALALASIANSAKAVQLAVQVTMTKAILYLIPNAVTTSLAEIKSIGVGMIMRRISLTRQRRAMRTRRY